MVAEKATDVLHGVSVAANRLAAAFALVGLSDGIAWGTFGVSRFIDEEAQSSRAIAGAAKYAWDLGRRFVFSIPAFGAAICPHGEQHGFFC
jgi:hypothetical protein